MVSLAYSASHLATAGAFEDSVTYMNHNITTEVCKFSGKRSLSMRIYITFLFLIMVTNLITTAGFYIPVLRQVKISFRLRTGSYKIHRDSNVTLQTETSQATHTSDIENDDAQKPKKYVELQVVERKVEALILLKKVRFETCDITNEQVETSNNYITTIMLKTVMQVIMPITNNLQKASNLQSPKLDLHRDEFR